jgi:hypothetical protein
MQIYLDARAYYSGIFGEPAWKLGSIDGRYIEPPTDDDIVNIIAADGVREATTRWDDINGKADTVFYLSLSLDARGTELGLDYRKSSNP